MTPNQLRDMGKFCLFSNGYSSEFAAEEALQKAIKDGRWRVGPQVLLLVAQFFLPPWFDRFFDVDTFQPVWMQGVKTDCQVCGRRNAEIKDGPWRYVRQVRKECFYPGDRQVGGSCSERCSWWAAEYCAGYEEHMPFWAKQYTLTQVDHYALVTAIASSDDTPDVVHLELGYSMRIKPEMGYAIPVTWFVKSQGYDLSGLLKARGVFRCWCKLWDDLDRMAYEERVKRGEEAERATRRIRGRE